jgi:hypothetical protein
MIPDQVLAVAKAIAESGADSCSCKRLQHRFPDWDIGEVLDALEALGCLKTMGALGLYYEVCHDELQKLITTGLESPAAEGDEDAEESEETTPAVAPAPAEEESEAPVPVAPVAPAPKAKLKNELPKAKTKAKAPKKSKLDLLLEQINASQAPSFLEGDERAAAIDQTVDRMIDVIVRVNAGITALSERAGLGIVDPDADLIALTRVKEGAGGIKATYSADGGRTSRVLFFEAWPQYMNEEWCDRAVRRLEKCSVDMLGRMTEYCLKRSSPKKGKKS